MADSLTDVSTALGLMVLEQLPAGGFSRTPDASEPAWFVQAFQQAAHDEPLSLLDVFPVLDAFLQDAENLWCSGTDGRADSEPFVITDDAGHELPIAATALAVGGRRYLVMQPAVAFKDAQRLLQTARDQSLAHERLVRQLQALQKPIAILGRLVGDRTFATDGPRAADAVRQQVDILRGLAGELPQSARGVTPKSR
jgi:hypothetical protein